MNNILVAAALIGLAFTAITNGSWPWLAAVIAIAVASYASRNVRVSTRVQLIFAVGLAGGLGAEIVRSVYIAVTGSTDSVPMYRQVLIVSLGSVIIVLAAMFSEHILRKLIASWNKQS